MLEVSLIAAFVGGLLSFLAPCGAIILPSFLLYSFKEKKDLLKASFIFYIGFLFIFIPFGLGISFLLRPLIVYQQGFIWIVGLIFILLGILAFFGKGLHIPFPKFIKPKSNKKDIVSLLFLGIAFAFALIGCSAPILGAIVTLASISEINSHVILLLFTYSLGLVSPLFILSFFADKYDFSRSRIMRGKIFELKIGRKKINIHSTNLITAIIFIVFGIVFIISRGSFYLTQLIQKIGLMDFYFKYSDQVLLLDLARRFDNILVLLLLFIVVLFIWRKTR